MASLPSETQQLAIRVAQEFVAVREEMAALDSASTFAELTDAASCDLPATNGPLSSALAGKAATSHTHTASQISDSTTTGRALLTAATQSDARTTGLGSGATGDALFVAANSGAARTTLGLATTDAVTFGSVIGSTRVAGAAVNSPTFTDTVINTDGTIAGNPRSTLSGGRLNFRSSGGVGWSSSASSNFTLDTGISRASSGVVEINSGTAGDYRDMLARNITATGAVRTGGYTFATLPTPTTGMRAYITNGAAAPVYMANAAGGGSTVTPVFYNGTNWVNA